MDLTTYQQSTRNLKLGDHYKFFQSVFIDAPLQHDCYVVSKFSIETYRWNVCFTPCRHSSGPILEYSLRVVWSYISAMLRFVSTPQLGTWMSPSMVSFKLSCWPRLFASAPSYPGFESPFWSRHPAAGTNPDSQNPLRSTPRPWRRWRTFSRWWTSGKKSCPRSSSNVTWTQTIRRQRSATRAGDSQSRR